MEDALEIEPKLGTAPEQVSQIEIQWLTDQLTAYQAQLAIYGRALRELDPPGRSIRLGIYFTAIDQLWEYQQQDSTATDLIPLATTPQPSWARRVLPGQLGLTSSMERN